MNLEIPTGTIGRLAVIVYGDECFTAQVLDNVTGTERPKRVRIVNDPSLGGTVLMPSQYTFKDWADDD